MTTRPKTGSRSLNYKQDTVTRIEQQIACGNDFVDIALDLGCTLKQVETVADNMDRIWRNEQEDDRETA